MTAITVNDKPVRRPARMIEGDEFLTTFTKAGWAPEDVEVVARAFHVAHAEIEAWAAKLDRGNTTESEARFWITTVAAGAEVALLNRGKVVTPGILEATNAELHNYIDFYENELGELWERMEAREAQVAAPGNDPEWLLLRNRFDRLAGYLWECNQRSGVWAVTFPEAQA